MTNKEKESKEKQRAQWLATFVNGETKKVDIKGRIDIEKLEGLDIRDIKFFDKIREILMTDDEDKVKAFREGLEILEGKKLNQNDFRVHVAQANITIWTDLDSMGTPTAELIINAGTRDETRDEKEARIQEEFELLWRQQGYARAEEQERKERADLARLVKKYGSLPQA